jgi:hypothetical protein
MLLKEDMVMRTMGFAPLSRSSIGFDRLFEMPDITRPPPDRDIGCGA